MSTHTTLALGSDAGEHGGGRVPSSLAGALVPGSRLGGTSLRGSARPGSSVVGRSTASSPATGPAGAEVVRRAPTDLAPPEALSEPVALREPPALTGDAVPGEGDLEAGGSGGAGHEPPSAPRRGRGGRPKKDPEGRMALREHLYELRKRVVRAGLAVLLGAVAGWFLYSPLISYITEPLTNLASRSDRSVAINFSNVAASFDLQIKGAIWIGVIVSSPFWIYQLWAFITPGLTKKERRYAIGFVSAAVPLFLAGVVLAAFFIPRAVTFFTSFTPEGGSNFIDAPTYIGFVLRTVLTFGLAFLLPVVLVALNFTGLLPGKAILKAWRWVLVAALTFAAVATPTPDITAMFTLAAPIVVLFAIAIVIALLHDRRKEKRQAKEEANPEIPDDQASPL